MPPRAQLMYTMLHCVLVRMPLIVVIARVTSHATLVKQTELAQIALNEFTMTAVRRSGPPSSAQGPALYAILTIFVFLVVYLATVTDDLPADVPSLSKSVLKTSLRHSVVEKRQQLKSALKSLASNHMPARLAKLRESGKIVGERLGEIRAGTETVEEVLHSGGGQGNTRGAFGHGGGSYKPPMNLDEIVDYLSNWIHTLHEALAVVKHETYFGIWNAYHDLTVKTLYLWDRDYLERMPLRRDDGSIFLSLATYRDENCLNTVKWAFSKAKNPEKLFIGIVQQNCHADCKSGILTGGGMEDVPPDDDCKKLFCESEEGRELCARGHVRSLDIDEPESLGPYAARYFASKLWYGENWFMQTDSVSSYIALHSSRYSTAHGCCSVY
jgi:Glycosyltransferase (GlcNAc)